MSRAEWITGLTFPGMVGFWAASGVLRIDKTAIAFMGLGMLLLGGVLKLDHLRGEGEALITLIWFAFAT